MKRRAEVATGLRSTQIPLYLITFKQEVNLRDVRKIRYVYSCKIWWDKYRNARQVTQCHRCQGFGHGTVGCHQKPKLAKPTCSNCGEDHPANFSGCKAYKERIALIERQKALRNRIHKVNATAADTVKQQQKRRIESNLQPATSSKIVTPMAAKATMSERLQ